MLNIRISRFLEREGIQFYRFSDSGAIALPFQPTSRLTSLSEFLEIWAILLRMPARADWVTLDDEVSY